TLSVLFSGQQAARDVALITEDGRESTFGELERAVLELAGRLRAIGVERGDRVALVLANGPEFVQILLAITTLGAAAAPLNLAYTGDEPSSSLAALEPRLLP